jgi:DNA-directed RNA polymerase specialized sigma24 family protein
MREPEEHLDRLALKAQAGSEEALGELVERFRPDVERIAIDVTLRWRRQRDAALEDDLCQEGMIGLLGAVRNYDPAEGLFRPWAVKHIEWAVTRAVYKLHGLEPRKARAVLKALDALHREGVDNPSAKELADRANLPVEDVGAILKTLGTRVADEDELATLPDPTDFEDATTGHSALLPILQVCRGLGPDGFKFAVLLVLRDMEYEWKDITGLLAGSSLPLWTEALKHQYPSVLKVFPDAGDWPAVQDAFRTPPPALNPEALRQFFCRFRQRVLNAQAVP